MASDFNRRLAEAALVSISERFMIAPPFLANGGHAPALASFPFSSLAPSGGLEPRRPTLELVAEGQKEAEAALRLGPRQKRERREEATP